MLMSGYHVTPRENGWVVRRAGTSRASRRFVDKDNAVRLASRMGRKHGALVYIHDETGRVRERIDLR